MDEKQNKSNKFLFRVKIFFFYYIEWLRTNEINSLDFNRIDRFVIRSKNQLP